MTQQANLTASPSHPKEHPAPAMPRLAPLYWQHLPPPTLTDSCLDNVEHILEKAATLLADTASVSPKTNHKPTQDDQNAISISGKVQSRYKHEATRFSGAADENWNIALARYLRMSAELIPTAESRLHSPHVLRGH